MTSNPLTAVLAAIVFLGALSTSARAQVASGLLDPNVATEEELATLPGLDAALIPALVAERPFAGALALDAFLAQELARLKQYCFIPLDLNTASEADFRTIPGVGKRMAHEFEEYRPWKSKLQFEKEIGKYVDPQEVARLWRYMVIQETDVTSEG